MVMGHLTGSIKIAVEHVELCQDQVPGCFHLHAPGDAIPEYPLLFKMTGYQDLGGTTPEATEI